MLNSSQPNSFLNIWQMANVLGVDEGVCDYIRSKDWRFITMSPRWQIPISSSRKCEWSYARLHHYPLCWFSDDFHYLNSTDLFAFKFSGGRVKAAWTGKRNYWKFLAGDLHSVNHWMMAVLEQTRKQLCCSNPPACLFRYRTALLNTGKVEKRIAKYSLLKIATWQPVEAVCSSSIVFQTRTLRNWTLAHWIYACSKTETRHQSKKQH